MLMQDGFLREMGWINRNLRRDLSRLITECMTPGYDLSETVKVINAAMQRERSICSLIIQGNCKNDKLTPSELRNLLNCLEPLENKQV